MYGKGGELVVNGIGCVIIGSPELLPEESGIHHASTLLDPSWSQLKVTYTLPPPAAE